MKNTIVLVIFSIIINVTLAQSIEGKYNDNIDYILFEKGTADFDIQSNGGLTSDLFGKGKFEIIDEYLLIHTTEYTRTRSSFEVVEKADQYSKIVVRNEKGAPFQYVNIAFFNKLNKSISGGSTDSEGVFYLKNPDQINKMKLSCLGCSNLIIDYKPNMDYNVVLVDGQVIENQIVVFKIVSKENSKMTLILLTTDFKSKKCNSEALKRMYKNVRKNNYRERVFIR